MNGPTADAKYTRFAIHAPFRNPVNMFVCVVFLRRLRMLLHQPLHNALVAQHELSQTLYHAEALQSEVLDCLRNEVNVIVVDPFAIFALVVRAGFLPSVNVHWCGLPRVLRLALSLEHVQDRVHCAESSGATTSGRAMDDDRAAVGRLWLRRRVSVIVSNHSIALLNQTEKITWVSRSTEIRPI